MASSDLVVNAEQTFLDQNGNPLSGGFVYMYVVNTNTFKNTWKDQGETILNTNPIVLDQAGRAIIWGDGSYRQLVTDQFGNVQWDNITTVESFSGVITGDLEITGNLKVDGSSTVGGDATVGGKLVVDGDVTVDGSVQFVGGLIVDGIHNLGGLTNEGPVNINNNMAVTGYLTVAGNTTLNNLTVAGSISGLINHVHYSSPAEVVVGDIDKVIIMSPDSYYTVSIGAPSDYGSTAFFLFVNSSAVRGKQIAPSGKPSFILWPLQSIFIQNIDGVWVYQTSRWAPPGNPTFFVDNTGGDDAADGLDPTGSGAGCFQTVQHAYDTVLSVIDPQQPLSVTIQLHDTGSNPIQEIINLAGMSLASTFNVNIVGNPGNPDLCHWFLNAGGSNPMITIADFATVSFNGISFGVVSGGVPALIECRQLCIADFRNCTFANNVGGASLKVMDNGRMNFINNISISGSSAAFIQILYDGSIECSTVDLHITASINVGNFIEIIGSGSVNLTSSTFAGLTASMGGSRYSLNGPCCVITASSVTWPSGLTPGTTANGGVEI
jgi:hypothetical protein